MSVDDIRVRVATLEKRFEDLWHRVSKLWYGLWAGGAVAVVMGGGYVWYAQDAVHKLEAVADGLSSLKTDTLLIKAEQTRQSMEIAKQGKDTERAWKFIMKQPQRGDD